MGEKIKREKEERERQEKEKKEEKEKREKDRIEKLEKKKKAEKEKRDKEKQERKDKEAGWVRFEAVDPNKRFGLRGYRPFERARAIKRCENVAEKIDLLIDWVRYAFPPHHELDIFDVVMNVHLHLMTLSFEKIGEAKQEEIEMLIEAKVKDSDHLIPKSYKYESLGASLQRHENDRIRFVWLLFIFQTIFLFYFYIC